MVQFCWEFLQFHFYWSGSFGKLKEKMIEDIEIPKVKNVHIVAVKEWNKDFTAQQWNIYLINNRNDIISTALVMSRGSSENKKTSTLRHLVGDLPAQTSKKIEMIMEDVLGFTNEYLLTFFAENKLFEKRFVFEPHSINEKNISELPILEGEGIMAQ